MPKKKEYDGKTGAGDHTVGKVNRLSKNPAFQRAIKYSEDEKELLKQMKDNPKKAKGAKEAIDFERKRNKTKVTKNVSEDLQNDIAKELAKKGITTKKTKSKTGENILEVTGKKKAKRK